HPVKRFSRFQVLWPWRRRTNLYIAYLYSRNLYLLYFDTGKCLRFTRFYGIPQNAIIVEREMKKGGGVSKSGCGKRRRHGMKKHLASGGRGMLGFVPAMLNLKNIPILVGLNDDSSRGPAEYVFRRLAERFGFTVRFS